MITKLTSALLLAAIVTAGPAFADDGSGRPVPGLGPGGAGATNALPDDPNYEPVIRLQGNAVALYPHSVRHHRQGRWAVVPRIHG